MLSVKPSQSSIAPIFWLCVLLGLSLQTKAADVVTALQLLEELDGYPHAVAVATSEDKTIDHEVGLGSLRKVSGNWRYKRSERYSGVLLRSTWQIVDGYTSAEVLAELEERVATLPEHELLFSCEGRACGNGSQWANRVFGQRLLYGRDDEQRYRVYALTEGEKKVILVLYASARSSDRQYLHVDLLQIEAG
jgi:hypothetical protein